MYDILCLKLGKCIPQFCLNFGNVCDFCAVPLSPCFVTCDHLWKKLWTFLTLPCFPAFPQASLENAGTCSRSSVCRLADGSPMHVQIVFQSSVNFPKWNFHHVSNIIGAHFPVFGGKFSSLYPRICSICAGHPKHWASSVEGTWFMNLKNLSKMLCSFNFLLCKSYFKHFESFCSIFPKFKTNL